MDMHRATPDAGIPPRPPSASSSRSRRSSGSEYHGYPSSHGSHPEPFVLSGANTPLHEGGPQAGPSPLPHFDSYGRKPAVPRSVGTNPIAIEMPILPRKPRTASALTPPAPLSARGDVPGGYFPLHEDPARRIHYPHPFSEFESHHETPSPKAQGNAPGTPDTPSLALNADPAEAAPENPSGTLVTSYVPSGFHSSGTLPMGKYYPSNYEKRSHVHTPTPNPPKVAKSSSQVPTYGGLQKARPEGDARQKLQQYQRDMVAQATLAARKIMGGKEESSLSTPGFPSQGMPVSAPATADPSSPRLRPLGSPGPVTPMELESSAGSYLDKGRGAAGGSARDRERRPPMSPGDRMRAETRSPVATPAF